MCLRVLWFVRMDCPFAMGLIHKPCRYDGTPIPSRDFCLVQQKPRPTTNCRCRTGLGGLHVEGSDLWPPNRYDDLAKIFGAGRQGCRAGIPCNVKKPEPPRRKRRDSRSTNIRYPASRAGDLLVRRIKEHTPKVTLSIKSTHFMRQMQQFEFAWHSYFAPLSSAQRSYEA